MTEAKYRIYRQESGQKQYFVKDGEMGKPIFTSDIREAAVFLHNGESTTDRINLLNAPLRFFQLGIMAFPEVVGA